MNERIQELAYQAEDWAIAHRAEHGSAYFHVEYTRKFAELIVRECAQIGEDTGGDWNVKFEILKHFGVDQ